MPLKFLAPALIAAVATFIAASVPVGAGEPLAPGEQTGSHSAVRLLAGKAVETPGGARIFRAGLAFSIDPGWKTYWRYPGDSGVPPRFDFAGSRNVSEVEVLWPAPDIFDDGAGGRVIGYSGQIVLPLHIAPSEPNQPVRLQLDLDYAVCEKLCIPVRANLQLDLGTAQTSADDAITAAEAKVPRSAKLGEHAPLAIHRVFQRKEGERERIFVDVAGSASGPLLLLAEGPNPDWALPIPRETAGAPPGYRRFSFDLDGLPPGATARGAELRLTVVAGAQAVEVTTPLD